MLTIRQKQIKDFVDESISRKKIAPTEREIAVRFRLSPSTVHEHLEALQEKGYITKQKGKARSTEIIVKIPIIGTLIAREPTEADKKDPRAYFALKVQGNNLAETGIPDGSIVIFKFIS